jgi:hypothetical protein
VNVEALLKRKIETERDKVLAYSKSNSASHEALETLRSLAFHVKALDSLRNTFRYDGGTLKESDSKALQSVNYLDRFLCAAQAAEPDVYDGYQGKEQRRALGRVKELAREMKTLDIGMVPLPVDAYKPVEQLEALAELSKAELELLRTDSSLSASKRRIAFAEHKVARYKRFLELHQFARDRKRQKREWEEEQALRIKAARLRREFAASLHFSRSGEVLPVVEDDDEL